MSATTWLNGNRLNAAKMIAEAIRRKRKVTPEVIDTAVQAHMITKNPPQRIKDLIVEEARKLAKGTCSLEVTQMIVADSYKPQSKERAVRRLRKYKAGTQWGREERKDVYEVENRVPCTPPNGLVRVKGCRCQLPVAGGTEFTMTTTKCSGMVRLISEPVFAYGGAGWWIGSIVEYSEPQKIGDGYGSISASLSFHFADGAGGDGGKPYHTVMKLVDWRLDKHGRKIPLDPEEYHYETAKKAKCRPPVRVYLSVGVETREMWHTLRAKMTEHLKGKPLCSAPLPLYRWRGKGKA